MVGWRKLFWEKEHVWDADGGMIGKFDDER